MTDYPQWPFGVSQINRNDRALRELFGVAYYPGLVNEGEPATGDRQAFVNGIFGDIFDVLVASDGQSPTSNIQGQSSNLQSRGVAGRLPETSVARANKSGAGKKEELEADKLLVAVGRKPILVGCHSYVVGCLGLVGARRSCAGGSAAQRPQASGRYAYFC